MHHVSALLCWLFVGATLATALGCGGGAGGPPSPGDAGLGDASLTQLALSTGTLDAPFDPETTEYTASLGALQQTVRVTPTAADASTTILVDGLAVASGALSPPISLAVGETDVAITTTANDGITTQSYTLTLTRSGEIAPLGSYIKASNADARDGYGRAIAISGDTLVVGSNREDGAVEGGEEDNNAFSSGAAYVYVRDETGWRQQARLKASNADPSDLFGSSVAISGNRIVVGAPYESSDPAQGAKDNSAEWAGAAYVFVRTGESWVEEALLKASNAGAGDWFGQSVAIDKDRIVVGAPGESGTRTGGPLTNELSQSGAAYLFVHDGGEWREEAYLKASNADASDRFGQAVAVSGSTLVVGTFGEDSGPGMGPEDNSLDGAGAAYVFERDGNAWIESAFLKASNVGGDYFGLALALHGDTLVVGAHREDSDPGLGGLDDSLSNSGAAYVFTRASGVWGEQAILKASNAGASDQFGLSVALWGDTIVVGAPYERSASAELGELDDSAGSTGAAYVFVADGSAWSQVAYLKATNAEGGDLFGWSVGVGASFLAAGATGEDSAVDAGPEDNSRLAAGAAYAFR